MVGAVQTSADAVLVREVEQTVGSFVIRHHLVPRRGVTTFLCEAEAVGVHLVDDVDNHTAVLVTLVDLIKFHAQQAECLRVAAWNLIFLSVNSLVVSTFCSTSVCPFTPFSLVEDRFPFYVAGLIPF